MAWITALCLMGDSMLYIVLPLHWKEAGLESLVQVGVVLSVNRLIRLPLNPIVSRIYRYITLRQGLGIAFVLAIITTASYGIADSFLFWIGLRALWGFAWSLLRLGGYYAILDLQTERNRGQLFGVYNGHYRVGSLVGMLLGGGFAELLGLRALSLLLAALALCGIPIFLKMLPFAAIRDSQDEHATERQSTFKKNKLALFKTNGVLSLLVTALGSALIFEGMFASLLSNYIENKQLTATWLGFTIGGALLSGGLQAMRWGWSPFLSPYVGRLTDRKFHAIPMIAINLIASWILLLAFPLSMPLAAWILVTLGILLCSTFISTLLDYLAASVAARQEGDKRDVITVYSITLDLGAALGPVAAFWIVENVGFYPIYWGSAGVFIALSIYWFRRNQQRSKPTESMKQNSA
ncbi:MFS transporter [Cohnella herbarum]|uniref:MFS transporter n=1 Tax=Cohnella herbarum TaxID=2728023 RepID=A0A7Z2VFR5_9BACL|nr:MFS transporter [Cohnella herbarum]QJD82120.1 MFS transporter [Cohnella herbarum]